MRETRARERSMRMLKDEWMEWTADGANSVVLSSDGNHAYVTGFADNAVSWMRET